MIIGFVHLDRGSDQSRRLAEMMVASCRRVMPDVPIVQMTDFDTQGVSGVSCVSYPSGPLALSRLRAYEQCEGDWLLLDTDVIARKDVRHVFDQPFDIAVATREGTLMPHEVGTWVADEFNSGVIFSRSQLFWQRAVDWLEQQPEKLQGWMGDQAALNAVIRTGEFNVAVLPNVYNYPPRSRDEPVRDKSLVHLKGKRRKRWLERYANC